MNKTQWYETVDEYYAKHKGGIGPDIREEKVLELCGSSNKILSLGVHSGYLTNLITEKNSVQGIDLPNVVEKFRDKYNFEVFSGSVEDLPFEDNSFDIVFCGNLLPHLDSPAQCIRESFRVLKEKGMIIITTPTLYIGGETFNYVFDFNTLTLFMLNLGFSSEQSYFVDEKRPTIIFVGRKNKELIGKGFSIEGIQ